MSWSTSAVPSIPSKYQYFIDDPGNYRWPAAIIAGFALTGALPTIFNAVVLVFTVTFRAVSLFTINTALYLHELLTEVDSQGNAIGGWRSIALISAVIGLAYATIRLWAGDYSAPNTP